MSFVTKTFTTECPGDLIDTINEDPDLGGQGALCSQIIDPQDGTSTFEFSRDLTADEDTQLDSILASWVCPITPPADDGSTVINDDLPPSTETSWTSEKINNEIVSGLAKKADDTFTELSTTSTLEVGNRYFLNSSDVFSLPDTTTVIIGNTVNLTKSQSVNPTINVADGGSVDIVTDIGTDTSINYDTTQEVVFVFDGADWTLEFGAAI